jgi:hypothetical protein
MRAINKIESPPASEQSPEVEVSEEDQLLELISSVKTRQQEAAKESILQKRAFGTSGLAALEELESGLAGLIEP